MTYYPSNDPHATCNKCNRGLSFPDGSMGTNGPGASPGKSNQQDCEVYCNKGGNNDCDTSRQTFCGLSKEYISQHADVGGYPMDSVCGASNEAYLSNYDIIYQKWTANKWNSLVNKLNTAGRLGATQSQGGSGPSVPQLDSEDIITADIYNLVRNKISSFNTSYPSVSKDDVITATIANAMKTAYENAKFNSNVCDICNALGGNETPGSCTCNCPRCSSCPSCSTCPSCSCHCNCPCNCGCAYPCLCPLVPAEGGGSTVK